MEHFRRLMAAHRRRPTDILEQMAEGYIRQGKFPRERVKTL